MPSPSWITIWWGGFGYRPSVKIHAILSIDSGQMPAPCWITNWRGHLATAKCGISQYSRNRRYKMPSPSWVTNLWGCLSTAKCEIAHYSTKRR